MKISKDKYYYSLALYILARRKQSEVYELEKKMGELLGEDFSHASDAIYNQGNTGSQEEFDEAIKKMDIVVEVE